MDKLNPGDASRRLNWRFQLAHNICLANQRLSVTARSVEVATSDGRLATVERCCSKGKWHLRHVMKAPNLDMSRWTFDGVYSSANYRNEDSSKFYFLSPKTSREDIKSVDNAARPHRTLFAYGSNTYLCLGICCSTYDEHNVCSCHSVESDPVASASKCENEVLPNYVSVDHEDHSSSVSEFRLAHRVTFGVPKVSIKVVSSDAFSSLFLSDCGRVFRCGVRQSRSHVNGIIQQPQEIVALRDKKVVSLCCGLYNGLVITRCCELFAIEDFDDGVTLDGVPLIRRIVHRRSITDEMGGLPIHVVADPSSRFHFYVMLDTGSVLWTHIRDSLDGQYFTFEGEGIIIWDAWERQQGAAQVCCELRTVDHNGWQNASRVHLVTTTGDLWSLSVESLGNPSSQSMHREYLMVEACVPIIRSLSSGDGVIAALDSDDILYIWESDESPHRILLASELQQTGFTSPRCRESSKMGALSTTNVLC